MTAAIATAVVGDVLLAKSRTVMEIVVQNLGLAMVTAMTVPTLGTAFQFTSTVTNLAMTVVTAIKPANHF